jgi:hypothetical protein
VIILGLVTVLPLIAGEQNRGAATMALFGGKTGKVPFPHHDHQKALNDDCQACHAAFPQKAGAIEELKASGDLAKKFVMNKQCVKCHKAMKKAGKKSGPTSCKKCHQK